MFIWIIGFILWSLSKGNILLAVVWGIFLYNYYQTIKLVEKKGR